MTLQQATQYALDNYPAIRASPARVSAQEAGVDLARTSYLPRLDSTTTNWAVGLTVTFPIFDLFSNRERKRIEAHNERAKLATYDRIVQEINAQSEQARAEADGARRVAENTPIQLTAARVLEEQARARYDASLGTIVEVADSQRLLSQAEVGDAVARIGIWRARLAEAEARGDLSDLLR